MTGPISFEFAATVGSIVGLSVSAAIYFYTVFQTKADAADAEHRLREQFDKELVVIKKSVEDVHSHLEAVRKEIKDKFGTVELELRAARDRGEGMREDIAWMRGNMMGQQHERKRTAAGEHSA